MFIKTEKLEVVVNSKLYIHECLKVSCIQLITWLRVCTYLF